MPKDLNQYAESLAKPLEVLIVDDDPKILEMLRHIFEQYNVRCTFAETVQKAIQAVQAAQRYMNEGRHWFVDVDL